MGRRLRAVMIAISLLPLAAPRAPAQAADRAVDRAVVGAAIGIAGGAGITLSAIVARARFQREYLEDADDLIHWQTTPMIAAPAAGIVFGLAGEKALLGSIAGSVTGMLAGAAAGAGLGWLLSSQQEWPWAGGVIGGGVGLSIGGLLGGLTAWSRDEEAELDLPDALRLGVRIPLR